MTFKDKHALAGLPARMAAWQMEIARQHGVLADPGLYARDPAGFARAGDALARAEAELAAAEERWLELEMLREEMEGR
jgi:ATP-binding cassette subfamily F protein uup